MIICVMIVYVKKKLIKNIAIFRISSKNSLVSDIHIKIKLDKSKLNKIELIYTKKKLQ